MKVSNQVFTTSNSNKCVGGLYLCMYVFISVQGTYNSVSVHGGMYVCMRVRVAASILG